MYNYLAIGLLLFYSSSWAMEIESNAPTAQIPDEFKEYCAARAIVDAITTLAEKHGFRFYAWDDFTSGGIVYPLAERSDQGLCLSKGDIIPCHIVTRWGNFYFQKPINCWSYQGEMYKKYKWISALYKYLETTPTKNNNKDILAIKTINGLELPEYKKVDYIDLPESEIQSCIRAWNGMTNLYDSGLDSTCEKLKKLYEYKVK